MPNWCSNRMYFSGEPAQIAEIKRLASGAVHVLCVTPNSLAAFSRDQSMLFRQIRSSQPVIKHL